MAKNSSSHLKRQLQLSCHQGYYETHILPPQQITQILSLLPLSLSYFWDLYYFLLYPSWGRNIGRMSLQGYLVLSCNLVMCLKSSSWLVSLAVIGPLSSLGQKGLSPVAWQPRQHFSHSFSYFMLIMFFYFQFLVNTKKLDYGTHQNQFFRNQL